MDDKQEKEPAASSQGEAQPTPSQDPLALRDKRIAELTDDLKRLQAEFENYKKRIVRENNDFVIVANQKLMAELLPILDSFDKALEATRGTSDAVSLRKGLEGLRKQLLQTLQRQGLREIVVKDKFDPFLHEAMMREEREDCEDGRILEVYQKGYTLGQKTLRPARVKVARLKEGEGQTAAEEVGTNHNHDTSEDTETEDKDQE